MIHNFTPQPYELHAFTADKTMWLVLGWTTTGAGLRAVGVRYPRVTDAVVVGAPAEIDPVAFAAPTRGCTCTG